MQPALDEGLRLHQQGRLDEAEACYNRVLAATPSHDNALHLLGVIFLQRGQDELAAQLIGRAIARNNRVAAYHINLGTALRRLGRPEEALASYETAIGLEPGLAEVYSNRGATLNELGRLALALDSFDKALAIKADYPEAWSNRGKTLHDLGRWEESLASYDQALRLRPNFIEALSNRGNTLGKLGRFEEALASFGEALRLEPNFVPAHSNRGNTLKVLGRHEEAIAAFTQAIALRPDFADAHCNRLFALQYQETTGSGRIWAAARQFGAVFDRQGERPTFAQSPDPARRLRVGYVSGDFRRHPVGYFIAPVLANHGTPHMETFCYTTVSRSDDLTATLRAHAGHWRSLVGLTDQEAAQQIRRDGIDILVDLSGHTAGNRLLMFTHRPAPVQVSWMGYVGTTGLAAMDYILADRFVVPEGTEGEFTETVWRLPANYLCYAYPDADVAIRPPIVSEAEGITFGSFNNNAKTSTATIALWAALLRRVPDSRLLLKTSALGDGSTRQELTARFQAEGIAAERLILEGAVPWANLLAAYNRIDIALDTTPYGGGVTTAEALWMGVPVVSLRGGTWPGRTGESILQAAGLPELVASDAGHFVEIAAALAADPARRTHMRQSLRNQLETSPFCDGAGFTSQLEAAYRGMWQRWCERRNAP